MHMPIENQIPELLGYGALVLAEENGKGIGVGRE